MATKPPNGIYTFSGRPGSSYKYENNQWFVSNSGTKNQYVPMQDPTGNRAKTLEAGLKSGKTQFTQILPTKSSYNQLTVSTPADNTKVIQDNGLPKDIQEVARRQEAAQRAFEESKRDEIKAAPEYSTLDKIENIVRNPLVAASYAMQPGDFAMPMNYSEFERSPNYQDDTWNNNLVAQGLNFASYFTPAGLIAHGIDNAMYTGTDVKKAINSGELSDWKQAGMSALNTGLDLLAGSKFIGGSGRLLNTGENATLKAMQASNKLNLPTSVNTTLGTKVFPKFASSPIKSADDLALSKIFPQINPNSIKYNPVARNAYNNAVGIGNAQNVVEATTPLVSSSKIEEPFKSEIDWGKWNPETPTHKVLMDEYNAIEESTKKDGTWMKNPDGTPFVGSNPTKEELLQHGVKMTPEEAIKAQFVQQQSSFHNKAFGKNQVMNPDGSHVIYTHGSPKRFSVIDESMFGLGDPGYSGRGFYTFPNREGRSSYELSAQTWHTGKMNPTTYKLYGKTHNPIRTQDLKEGQDLMDFNRLNPQGVPISSEHDAAIRTMRGGIRIAPDYLSYETVFPKSTSVKSAIGNVGFFDMTNPNIYKSLLPYAVPVGLGLGLGAAQKYPNGGGMKTVKSKDGTITNKFTNKEGNTVVQVKTKDGRYYEKVLEPQIKPLDNTPRYQNALLNNPAVVADNTRVANADFAAAAVANKPNVDRAVAAEKKAQYEFEKDKWEDYNKMSPTEKVVDRVDAFLTDPLGMFSRAVSGEQAYIPGMGQGLVDYENPNRNRYLQAVGYTPGKFEASDIQNMANPGYWGASITNNLNKGNYGTAAAETALSLFPFLPKGSGRLVKQGAGMLADDIAKAGNSNVSGSKQLIDLSKVDFSKVEKPSEWLSRYQLANQLRNEGLIPTNVASTAFGRSKDVTGLVTKEALERANTVYRATTPNISKVGAKDIMAMLDKGVDLSDEIAVAEYMNTHVPYESYGYRANPISPGYGQDLLYTGNYENLEEAAKGLSHYGTHISELRPNLDFTTGTPQEWFQKYYQERPFIFTGKGGKNAGLGSRELGWKEGAIATFPGDKKYYPFVGNKGSQLLNAVSTTPISKINYTEVIPPVSTAKPSSMFKSGLGNVGMDMSMYTIKNPDYYTQLLNTYDKKALSATNRKFYKDLIATVKKQDGLVTERQLNELKRLATGNFNYGPKDYSAPLKAGFDENFITRPLTPFGKTELTPGNQWYRKIGNEKGLQDLINKQSATAPAPMRMKSGITLDAPFFGRGQSPAESYKGLYAVELKPEAASKYQWASRVAGVDNYGSVPLQNDKILKGVPLEDLNVYKKKWFSNNYKELDPNNLEEGLKHAALQRNLENIYKWGARGYLGKSAYDYMNKPDSNKKYGGYNKGYAEGGSLAKNIPTYYDYSGTPIYRDTTALPFADGGILDRIRKRLNTKEEEKYNPSKDLSLLNKYNSEIKQIQDLEESDPRRVEYEKANSQFVLDKAKYDEALKSYEDQLLLFNEYNNLDPKAKLQISPEEFIQIKKDNKNIEEYLTPSKFYTPYSKNYSGIGNAQDFKKIIPDYDQEIFNARRLLNNPDYYMDMSGSATDEQISNIINETREKYKNLYPNTNTVGFLRELDVTAEPFFRGKDRKYTVPKTPQVENYTNYKTFQKIFPNINDSYYEGRVAGASNTYSSGYGYDRIELENNPKLAISTYSDSAGRVIPYYKPEFVSYGASNMFSPYPEFSQPNELSPAPVAPSLTYEERVYPYAPVKVYNSKTNTWENRVAPAGSLQDKYTREREAWRLRNGNNPSSHLPIGQAPGGTFADGGPLNDKTNHGKILDSVYASAIGDYYANGGMLKRADGSYSRRGLWDNIRAAAARNKAQGKPGKAPTKEMLEQAKVSSKANGGFVAGRQMYQPLDIRESYGGFLYGNGGQFPTTFSLPEDSFKQGGNNLHDSVYASSMAQYPAVYGMGGSILSMSNTPELSGEGKDLSVPENAYIYSAGGSIKKFKK